MANLLNTSSVLLCPHGGTVEIVSSNTQVMAGGDPLVTASDTFTISGCTFSIGPNPHPCVEVQWVTPDESSQIGGDFTLNEDSVGLCVAADQAVQGAVEIDSTQESVSGL